MWNIASDNGISVISRPLKTFSEQESVFPTQDYQMAD